MGLFQSLLGAFIIVVCPFIHWNQYFSRAHKIRFSPKNKCLKKIWAQMYFSGRVSRLRRFFSFAWKVVVSYITSELTLPEWYLGFPIHPLARSDFLFIYFFFGIWVCPVVSYNQTFKKLMNKWIQFCSLLANTFLSGVLKLLPNYCVPSK